jgi:hypothetical protein
LGDFGFGFGECFMTEYNVFGDGFENKRLNKHCPVSG